MHAGSGVPSTVKCDKMQSVAQVCPRCESRYHDEAIFCQVDGVRLVAEEEGADPYLGTELLGQFRIEEILGEGGMGRVYRAHQENLGRDVAVKVLHRDLAKNNPDATRRFHREARVTTALDHPNVVNVFMFGEMPDSSPYLVMEYLDGVPLHVLLEREGRLAMPRALHIAIQVAEGVGQAHESGIVHRDVKPENVLIVKRGADENFVKVLDFGIARLLWDKETVATKAGLVFGTARYISPEGASGDPTDARSDVYSIAVLTYQLLCGGVPFEGESAVDLLLAHVNQRPPDIRHRCDGVPEAVAQVVMRSLSKDPRKRPANAQAYADALQAASEDSGLSQASRRSRGRTSTPFPPPNRTQEPTLGPEDDEGMKDVAGLVEIAPVRHAAPLVPEVTSIPGLQVRSFGRFLAISMLMVVAFVVGAGAVIGGAWLAGAFDLRPTMQPAPALDAVPTIPDAASEIQVVRSSPAIASTARQPGVYWIPEDPRPGDPVTLIAVHPQAERATVAGQPHFRVYRRGRSIGGDISALRGEGDQWVGSFVFRRRGEHQVRFYLGAHSPAVSRSTLALRSRSRRPRPPAPDLIVPVSETTSSTLPLSPPETTFTRPEPSPAPAAPEPAERTQPAVEPPVLDLDPTLEAPPQVTPVVPTPDEPWPGAGAATPWIDESGGAIL